MWPYILCLKEMGYAYLSCRADDPHRPISTSGSALQPWYPSWTGHANYVSASTQQQSQLVCRLLCAATHGDHCACAGNQP